MVSVEIYMESGFIGAIWGYVEMYRDDEDQRRTKRHIWGFSVYHVGFVASNLEF